MTENSTENQPNTLNPHHEQLSVFKRARISLSGAWTPAILTALIIGAVSIASGIIPLGSIIVMGPLYLGAAIWALKFVRKENYDYDDVFAGFNNFGNALVTGLLMILIIFGFFLLFIIPGIIAALALSQSFFILAENPDMKPTDVLRKSRDMMRGHKGDLFAIYIVFFLLSLACLLTLGIGFFFLVPYTRIVLTHFYLDVRGEEAAEEKNMKHLVE